MIRRFVYDPVQDRVIEVAVQDRSAQSPAERYEEMLAGYRKAAADRSEDIGKAGQQLRAASLERADRREFAHRRLLDEKRWSET